MGYCCLSDFTVQMERLPFLTHKTFFMLNSAELDIYPAHKCENANNCWHFHIYEQDKLSVFEF